MTALVACGHDGTDSQYDEQLRKQVDSIVYADRSVEALKAVLVGFEDDGNRYGVVAACRELGRSYRNASQFSEAVDAHKKGLAAAEEIGDTIQIIQALNNIGTDYRRMSILDDASDYHYQALAVSDAYSDKTSTVSIKNRVVSLNGIGNVQLSLGNSLEAERVFREALKGETYLGSYLGQAINYANIGALLEERTSWIQQGYTMPSRSAAISWRAPIWEYPCATRISAACTRTRANWTRRFPNMSLRMTP